MQKQLTFLCAKTCQSYLTKENSVLLSECDCMIAHQFWPLVSGLQHKIIQHTQLGFILLISVLWAKDLWNHLLVASCLFPSLWQGIRNLTTKLLQGHGAGCLPVPLGVAAISPGCCRQTRKPDTVSTALQLCWNCWHSAQFSLLILLPPGLWPGEGGRTFLERYIWSRDF